MHKFKSDAREIFLTAVERWEPDEWPAYLDQACAGDEALRAQVETLLQAHRDLGRFIDDAPVLDENETDVGENPGTRVGSYEIRQLIGEGGFGAVYLAEQLSPVRRQVALKLIKPGMDTRAVIARFDAERQALALMDHPHIAKVFDAGATQQGRPYFVMEYVEGIPITEYCDQKRLTTRQRISLFVKVCQAVQHAHQKGIIHRDIKPSNVLVAEYDDQPVPKVIDFGVAKAIHQPLTEYTLATGLTQMIGTPLYMSPEQADFSSQGVDTRSDLYSLGVLLYELLTGTTPFDRERFNTVGYDEVRRIIREEEPRKPSALISTLGASGLSTLSEKRGSHPLKLRQLVTTDLDSIVMKCLEKRCSQRYESATALARDLQRFLDDEPVEARPSSRLQHVAKYARRHRHGLTVAGLVIAALLVGTVLIARQAVRATEAERLALERLNVTTAALRSEELARSDADKALQLANEQKRLADRQRDLTLWNLYVAQMRFAHQDWAHGHLSRMKMILDAWLPRNDAPDFRGWEWYYLNSLLRNTANVINPQLGPIHQVDWSPDGRRLAVGGRAGSVVYEPISRQIERAFPGHHRPLWSGDGTRLATVATEEGKTNIKLWATDNWRELASLTSQGRVDILAWRPDSHGLGWSSGGQFNYWKDGDVEVAPMRHPAERGFGITGMAWGPESRLLLLGGAFPAAFVYWDTEQDKSVREFETHNRGISHIAVSPNGKRFATARTDGYIDVWTLEDAVLQHKFDAHKGYASACDWSPDGMYLVSGGADNLIRVWNPETGQEVRRFAGHRSPIHSVDWSPSDGWFASGAQDGTVRLWRLEENYEALMIPGRQTVAWSPDGRMLVSNDPRQVDVPTEGITYSIRDPQTGQIVRALESPNFGSMFVFAWSPDGRLIGGAGYNNGVFVWDAMTGRLVHRLPNAHSREARCFAWSPDSRQFATCAQDGKVRIWETASGKLLVTPLDESARLGSVGWSPDGRWFASADWERDIKIWTANEWQLVHEIDQEPVTVGVGANGDYLFAWSPDSRRLACVNGTGEIIVREISVREIDNEVATQRLWSADAHAGITRSIAWSPDGKRIATGSEDRTAKIWDAETGRELLTLDDHPHMVTAVVWSPDGRKLATADSYTLRIWDATLEP